MSNKSSVISKVFHFNLIVYVLLYRFIKVLLKIVFKSDIFVYEPNKDLYYINYY